MLREICIDVMSVLKLDNIHITASYEFSVQGEPLQYRAGATDEPLL